MIASMIRYGKSLVGTPYGVPWKEGDICLGNHGPFWAAEGQPPPAERLHREGVVCTGLINLMCRNEGLTPPFVDAGLSWAGTTDAWWECLREAGALKPYRMDEVYPVGTLLLAPYEGPGLEEQGHIGMIVEDGQFLHSWLDGGGSLDTSPAESHVWARYHAVALPEDWLAAL